MAESEVAFLAFQLLKGISHVHNKGFIHCDLKPSNVLVFPSSNGINLLKLADFGLALRVAGDVTHTIWNRNSVCHHRGTLLYASPEAVALGIHGKAVDIWGLGCVVAEMITGKELWPYRASATDYDIGWKITQEEPEILSSINGSKMAKHFLGKCLERDYKCRWTAEMLLNHPFIKSAAAKYANFTIFIEEGNNRVINPFGSNWVSKKNLFSSYDQNTNIAKCRLTEGSKPYSLIPKCA